MTSMTDHGIQALPQGPILMVDDSFDDFNLANTMYKRTSLTRSFLHCRSGAALFSYLDEALAGRVENPALILMDLNMPGMNGIETTVALRQRAECASIPVIAMLTSSTDPKDRAAATDAGVHGYLQKPMRPSLYVDFFESLTE